MSSKRKLLVNAKLYLILDAAVNSYDQLLSIVRQAMNAGIDIIQLRDKKGSAKDILKFSKNIQTLTQNRIPYIINDRLDLALLSKSQGVHLGQEDISLKDARYYFQIWRILSEL